MSMIAVPVDCSRNREENPPSTIGSEKIIGATSLFPNNLFVEKLFCPTRKNDQRIFFRFHYFFRQYSQFFQFNLRNIAFENRILYPIQIFAAQFQHFSDALFSNIIYQNYIHCSNFFMSDRGDRGFVFHNYQYILNGLYSSIPSKCLLSL